MLDMLKRKMAMLEYQCADSISRLWNFFTVTNIIDFDDDYKPKVIWYEQTGYDHNNYGEEKHTKVTYEVVKDKDGYEQIFIEKITVEKYARVWDGSEFVDPKAYPP